MQAGDLGATGWRYEQDEVSMHSTDIKSSPSLKQSTVTTDLADQTASPLHGFGISSPDELLIEAGSTEQQYWRDLWRYRELLYFLAWRDLLVRYKQTLVG